MDKVSENLEKIVLKGEEKRIVRHKSEAKS
jgi:hypothetical protein